MNTQEFVEKSRGRRNTGGVNEHQRNLPAYDKSSDAERRMENTIRINGSFSEYRLRYCRLQVGQTQPGHPMDFVGIIFSFLQSRFRSVKH